MSALPPTRLLEVDLHLRRGNYSEALDILEIELRCLLEALKALEFEMLQMDLFPSENG